MNDKELLDSFTTRTDNPTEAEVIAFLDAYDRSLVEIVRVVVAPDGIVTKHISRGFVSLPGYEPPDQPETPIGSLHPKSTAAKGNHRAQ